MFCFYCDSEVDKQTRKTIYCNECGRAITILDRLNYIEEELERLSESNPRLRRVLDAELVAELTREKEVAQAAEEIREATRLEFVKERELEKAQEMEIREVLVKEKLEVPVDELPIEKTKADS